MTILKNRRSQGIQAYRRAHTDDWEVKKAGKGKTKAPRQNKDKQNKLIT